MHINKTLVFTGLVIAAVFPWPQWAKANAEFDCTPLKISREVNWLASGTSRDITIRWVIVAGPETKNLMPSNIEIEGVMPTEAAQRLRRAVSNIRCDLKTSGRANRWSSPRDFGLALTTTFRPITPKDAPPSETRATNRQEASVSQPENAPQDFNPIEQRIKLQVSVDGQALEDKECRISASGDQLGFPLSRKSGDAFIAPRTLTSNLLIASCEVLPFVTLSQSTLRDTKTGLFPSILEINVTSDELETLRATSETEAKKLEQELASELADARRQAERARIQAEAAKQRALEEQQIRDAQREEREAQLAAERAEAEERQAVMNDALGLLRTAQRPLLDYYESQGRWPVALTGRNSFGQLLDEYASEHAFNLRLVQSSTTPFESVTVSVTLYNSSIEGNLSLAYDGRTRRWTCFSTDIPEDVLPSNCGIEKPDFPAPTSVFDL